MGADKKTVGIMLQWFWKLWVRVTALSLCQMLPAPLARAPVVNCVLQLLHFIAWCVNLPFDFFPFHWFIGFSCISFTGWTGFSFIQKGVQVIQITPLWNKRQKIGTTGRFPSRADIILTTTVMETHSQQVTINNIQQQWRQVGEVDELPAET